MTLPLIFFLRVIHGDIVYVRHGETLANVSGRYNAVTTNNFSPAGEKMVVALTQELEAMPRFDAIAVSPSLRAMKTIAPYLRATHQKAVIWPLLYECCTGSKKASVPTRFGWGKPVEVPTDMADLFTVWPGMDREPSSPDYAAGLAQVDEAVKQFSVIWAGRRVLLVGHAAMGGRFLHELTGRWIKIDNAKQISIRQ